MEAINYIKKYHKPFIGEINYNYYDEEGRNYNFYELYYLNNKNKSNEFNQIFNENYNKNIKKLNICELELYYHNNYNLLAQDKTYIDLIITKEFKNLKKIVYDKKNCCCLRINKIYIENNNKFKKINAKCDIVLLNENMNIKYIMCNNLECNNCIIDELILKDNKKELKGNNQINNLELYKEININKNILINNITLNYLCNLDFLNNINYKKIWINCYYLNSYHFDLLFKLFQNKIIKNKDELKDENKSNYKYIVLNDTNKCHSSHLIDFYFNDIEVYY